MFFFFNDTATAEISTLSLHDALPISKAATATSPGAKLSANASATRLAVRWSQARRASAVGSGRVMRGGDRKSTRLNSSHANISYAVFCLKKNNHHDSYLYFEHAYVNY